MHGRAVIGLSLLLALVAAPAIAQDAAALRQELEQMRKSFEAMKQEYQKAIDALSERLKRLEAAPAPTATPPAPPAIAQPAPTPAAPPLTPADLLRRREPFSLYERRGPGQWLFDLGVVGDFIGNLTGRGVDRADAGTFAGRENRFFPREIELLLFGQIDPFARGEVRLEAGEEFEDGERTTDVGLAEAHLTLLTLPFGTQVKAGKVRNRFGLLNQLHREGLPQPDQPNVLPRFLGEEGLVESGLELTWVPPLPFYLEALVGVFNGDNDVAFGRGSLRDPLLTGRLRTFVDLETLGAVQLGASIADGQTAAGLDNTLWGVDAKYKFTPDGWRHALVTLAGEALWGRRRTAVSREVEIDVDGDGVADATEEVLRRKTRERSGWYVYAELQPWRRWLGGVRYDSTQSPEQPGREWAIEPYIAFMPSDFLRFRLGYKYTERDRPDFLGPSGGPGRVSSEIFLQGTFFLGAHPAHPF